MVFWWLILCQERTNIKNLTQRLCPFAQHFSWQSCPDWLIPWYHVERFIPDGCGIVFISYLEFLLACDLYGDKVHSRMPSALQAPLYPVQRCLEGRGHPRYDKGGGSFLYRCLLILHWKGNATIGLEGQTSDTSEVLFWCLESVRAWVRRKRIKIVAGQSYCLSIGFPYLLQWYLSLTQGPSRTTCRSCGQKAFAQF